MESRSRAENMPSSNPTPGSDNTPLSHNPRSPAAARPISGAGPLRVRRQSAGPVQAVRSTLPPSLWRVAGDENGGCFSAADRPAGRSSFFDGSAVGSLYASPQGVASLPTTSGNLPTRPVAARGGSSATVSTIRPSSIIAPSSDHSPIHSLESTVSGMTVFPTHPEYDLAPEKTQEKESRFFWNLHRPHRHHRSLTTAVPPEQKASASLRPVIQTESGPRYYNPRMGHSVPSSVHPSPRIGNPSAHALSIGIWADNSALHKRLSRSNTSSNSNNHLHYIRAKTPIETNVVNSRVDPVSGSKRINQYIIIDELGRGVHGKVKLGKDTQTGLMVAIKIVERVPKRRRLGRSTTQSDKIRREIAILKKARHPNIVGLIEVIDDPAIKKVYIVLEFVEMGEVQWRVPARAEIALVEYRRFLRESGQARVSLNDSSALEVDRAILRDASHFRQAAALTQGDHVDSPRNWSLENGSYSRNGSRRPSMAESGPAFDPSLYMIPADEDEGMSTAEMAPSEGLLFSREPAVEPRQRSFSSLRDSKYVPDHFKYVPIMTLDRARHVFRDTVLGVDYLHYQGIIHRDIKPANLLETKEGEFKISDFGVSYLSQNCRRGTGEDSNPSGDDAVDEAVELAKTVGTPAFYAPELCNTDENAVAADLGEQIDVWALGVMLYCFVYGRVPFHDTNTFVLMRTIARAEAIFPRLRLKAAFEGDGVPLDGNHRLPTDLAYEPVEPELVDLLSRLLVKNPAERITIAEIKQHAWFVDGIVNPREWAHSTDPSQLNEGKKIEVSSEDVVDAVVPLSIVERVASVARRIGDALGVVRDSSRRRRYIEKEDDAAASTATITTFDGAGDRASRHITASRSRDFGDSKTDRPMSAIKGLFHDAGHKILRSVRSRENGKVESAVSSAASTVSTMSVASSSSNAPPGVFSAINSTVASPLSSAVPSRSQSMSSPPPDDRADLYRESGQVCSMFGHGGGPHPFFHRRPSVGHPSRALVSSSSSEDDRTSDVTNSTSYPSIPSVMSQRDMKPAHSVHVDAIREEDGDQDDGRPKVVSGNLGRRAGPSGPAYAVDESDHSDNDDDEDGDFLFIPQRSKSQLNPANRRASRPAVVADDGLVMAASKVARTTTNLRRAATVSNPTMPTMGGSGRASSSASGPSGGGVSGRRGARQHHTMHLSISSASRVPFSGDESVCSYVD